MNNNKNYKFRKVELSVNLFVERPRYIYKARQIYTYLQIDIYIPTDKSIDP